MADLKVDYSGLQELVGEAQQDRERKEAREGSLRRALRRVLLWTAAVAVMAVLPFLMVVRVSVLGYGSWGLGTWPSVGVAALATAALLALYAWVAGRKVGAGPGMRRLLRRGAVGLGAAWLLYALLYVAGANVKSPEVRAEYRSLHPILRVAASTVILADGDAVITDAGRTEEDYWLMGLPVNEASLHFRMDDGWVHALDLRTVGRPEWRNRLVELYFWAMGFHSLRHVGTADHLHVSLRMPE